MVRKRTIIEVARRGRPGDGAGSGGAVDSVNGKTGAVVLTHTDVGASPATHTHPISQVTNLQTSLDGKASTSHTHGVSNLTATGTRDSTTFLRGDNTWAIPATESGAVAWGSITGTLSTQTDLNTALTGKADASTLTSHTGATAAHGATGAVVGTTNTQTLSNKTLASPAITGTPTGLTKTHVGLANVDNTTDLSKPISTATQTALNGKANTAHTHGVADLTATGTRSSSTILYGDNTWKTAPSGGTTTTEGVVGVQFAIDGGGAAIAAGATAEIRVPFDGTITGWEVIGAPSGSFVATISKSTYATFPTFTAISGTEKPTLSSGQKMSDTNLTTWTTEVLPGDYLRLTVDSATTVERVTVSLIIEGVSLPGTAGTGGGTPGPSIIDDMTTSQSLRGRATGPYLAPSAMTLPEDFGITALKGGTEVENETVATAHTAAINAAIQQAKLDGRKETGGVVGLLYGTYYINNPLILPRTGHPMGHVVHLIGSNNYATWLKGAPTFPANRGMIEWEPTVSRAWNQRIENIHFWLPDVAGTKAIYAKMVGATPNHATYAEVDAERMIMRLANLQFDSHNGYHEVVVDLENGLFLSEFHNLIHDPQPYWEGNTMGGYNTLLMRTPTGIKANYVPFHNGDTPGIAYSNFSLIRLGYRGGVGALFSGRLVNSTWDGLTGNSGFGGEYDVELINSVGTVVRNINLEGRSSHKILMKNCHTVSVEELHLGTPFSVYPKWQASKWYNAGDRVVSADWGASSNTDQGYYTASKSGTSGSTEPTWPTSGTVNDGTTTWAYTGPASGDGVVLEGSHFCTVKNRMGMGVKPPYSSFGRKILKIDSDCIGTRVENFQIEVWPQVTDLTSEYEDNGTDTQLDVVKATTIGTWGSAP